MASPEDFLAVSDDEPKTGVDDEGNALLVRRQPGAEWLAQVGSTEFGGSGLRYRRLDLQAHLDRGPAARYLELRRGGVLRATYYLAALELRAGGTPLTGVYRGLLTVAPGCRGTDAGRRAVNAAQAWLAGRAQHHARPVLGFGCIDAANARSLALLRGAGARELGTLRSQMVYRQWLRPGAALDACGDDESVRRALDDCYGDCRLASFGARDDPFLCLSDGGGIAVGARVTPTRIALSRSGGALDWFFHDLMPRVGFARRRFDPGAFAYLRLRDVVVRQGRERAWHDFIGALLAKFRTHMALLVLDPRSAVSRRLAAAGAFGRFARATRQDIAVMAAPWAAAADVGDAPLALQSPDM